MTTLHRRGGEWLVRHAHAVAGTAAGIMLASALVSVPALFVLHKPSQLILLPAVVAFIVSGWLLAVRLPTNVIGWLLLLTSVGLSFLTWSTLSAWLITHGIGAGRWLGSLSNGLFVFIVGGLGLLLPLLFPDGRLPSPRRWWRVVLWCDFGYMFFASFNVFNAGPLDLPALHEKVQNPLVVSWLTPLIAICVPLMFVGFAGSFSSIVVRWRTADDVQREQMKWVIVALAVAPVPFLLHDWAPAASSVSMTIILPLVPITIAVSVLRYRLYEIDRIISRAVAYLLVTGLLVGVYVGCIAIADMLLPVGSSVGVAASTLAAAALFQPVRRRVQRAVDRRFNRQRYDAARTIDAFATRLRDEVDPGVVSADLLSVTMRAVQPATVSLWLAT